MDCGNGNAASRRLRSERQEIKKAKLNGKARNSWDREHFVFNNCVLNLITNSSAINNSEVENTSNLRITVQERILIYTSFYKSQIHSRIQGCFLYVLKLL